MSEKQVWRNVPPEVIMRDIIESSGLCVSVDYPSKRISVRPGDVIRMSDLLRGEPMSETPRSSQNDELSNIEERIVRLKQSLQRIDAELKGLRADLIRQEAAHSEMCSELAQLEAMRDELSKRNEEQQE
jgi:septal ring factor EnvC (AmiA/AmiB activator)